MLITTDWTKEYGLPGFLIKGSIPISGIFDLEPIYYSWLQSTLRLNDDEIHKQSPLHQISDNCPPVLISYGEMESAEFKRQSDDYCTALLKKGVDAALYVQPGKNHFMTFHDLNDPDSQFCKRIVKFITQHKKSQLPLFKEIDMHIPL